MKDSEIRWVLALVQMPGAAARHRVAVWRELRKIGAVPVVAGAWVLPDSPAFRGGLARAEELCRRGDGTFAVLDVAPRGESAEAALRSAFVAARVDEWTEFERDGVKFEQEIAKETGRAKFTFGELEEEEQSLDRLRRWYRDLKRRDVLELPEAARAEQRLKACEEVLEQYAEQVYAAMRGGASLGDEPD
ncbi:chromate resistance protein ChrB [Amnibacterium sp. CER49]|uniref:Chromate resistance protein ChrB n=1 Tax=Amnibacterium sp. CER49 TaxID=3039161 RepID=UPI0024482ABE|nr:Chromate resistance protein ChrB [Amnibacterium sp. CER49]MDH2443492.1 chromate resistance protein ChrB [Amnibacterium sp. CER49]